MSFALTITTRSRKAGGQHEAVRYYREHEARAAVLSAMADRRTIAISIVQISEHRYVELTRGKV